MGDHRGDFANAIAIAKSGVPLPSIGNEKGGLVVEQGVVADDLGDSIPALDYDRCLCGTGRRVSRNSQSLDSRRNHTRGGRNVVEHEVAKSGRGRRRRPGGSPDLLDAIPNCAVGGAVFLYGLQDAAASTADREDSGEESGHDRHGNDHFHQRERRARAAKKKLFVHEKAPVSSRDSKSFAHLEISLCSILTIFFIIAIKKLIWHTNFSLLEVRFSQKRENFPPKVSKLRTISDQ